MSTKQQTERVFWRAYVRARADLFEQQAITYSNDGSGQPSMDGIQKQLDLARQATGIRIGHPSSRRRLFSTRPRASIEGAFVHLHTADIMLTQLLPPEEMDARSPYVLARLRECLSPRDQRVRTAEAELLRCKVASHRRAALAYAMRTVYTIADQQHARIRSFRHVLIVGTIVLALVVAGVVAVGYSAPSAIPLCFNPTLTAATQQQQQQSTTGQRACPAGKGHPAPGDVGLVALLGLLGGALSAAVASASSAAPPRPMRFPSRCRSSSSRSGRSRPWLGSCCCMASSCPACQSSTAKARSWPTRSC
jgi:hypothetical protein